MDEEKTLEIMQARHSVRSFTDEPISTADVAKLQEEIVRCNAESGLSIKLVTDESNAFDSTLAHYGKFANVRNYIVLAGTPANDFDEKCGCYGERLVLLAQRLGLNTCWVALTFKKRYVRKMLKPVEKLSLVIAIGHGVTQGAPRKSKSVVEVSSVPAGTERPEWFDRGVDAALLAPTAMNQQSFMIALENENSPEGKPFVSLTSKGGAYSDIDLGIVRQHFELGAGIANFAWS